MFRSAAIAFWRSLTRQPLYAALNILGLSFGVAVFIVLSLYVRFETGYERWLPGACDIYELRTTFFANGKSRTVLSSAGIALDQIRKAAPGLVATRVVPEYLYVSRGERVTEEAAQLVDRDFFRVFDLPLAYGDRATALRPGGVILSEAEARRLFGRSDVVGRTVTIREPEGAVGAVDAAPLKPIAYTVTGVFRPLPGNTSLVLGLVRLLDDRPSPRRTLWTNWGASSCRTFLRLAGAGDAARINGRMDAIVDGSDTFVAFRSVWGTPHNQVAPRLVPLVAEHLDVPKVRARVAGFAAVGVLVLVISLINYVNLEIARATLRAHEIAIRHAVGAAVADLRQQLLRETAVVTGAAGLTGVSLVELLLPVVNRWGGLQLGLDYPRDALFLLALLAAVVGGGLLAGIYPAALLCRAVEVRQSLQTRATGGKRSIRFLLVMAQFTAVVAAFILLAGFAFQVRHMQVSDLGLPRHGILTTWALNTDALSKAEHEAVLRRWRAVPGVRAVAEGEIPGQYYNSVAARDVTLDGIPQVPLFSIRQYDAALHEALAGQLLAGRLVDADDYVATALLPLGARDGEVTIDLNLTGARALGFAAPQDAVGRVLVHKHARMRVVGVVADQRLGAPTEALPPTLLVNHPSGSLQTAAVVRFGGVADAEMARRLETAWRQVAPLVPFDAAPLSQGLDEYYAADRQTTRLFAIGVVMAALVGVVGLYSMAAFSTSARATEIALRKVMGATRWQVMRLLVFQFVKPVLVANVIAWPIGGFILWKWLAQFDDRVAFSPWFFIAGTAASLFIAVITVAGLAFATASQSPGKVLRHE